MTRPNDPNPPPGDARPYRAPSVSETLEHVVDRYRDARVSVGELVHALHERGFGLLMAIFVLPNCVPVPIPPGGSTLLSLPLFFLSLQMVYGRETPWLPKWLMKKTLSRSVLTALVTKAGPKLRWIEKFLRPRLSFASTPLGERFVGVFWLICAISIAVPIPMTNFLPGVGILIMALGLLSKDGVVMLLGAAIGCFGLTVTGFVLLYGQKFAVAIFPFLPMFGGS